MVSLSVITAIVHKIYLHSYILLLFSPFEKERKSIKLGRQESRALLGGTVEEKESDQNILNEKNLIIFKICIHQIQSAFTK